MQQVSMQCMEPKRSYTKTRVPTVASHQRRMYQETSIENFWRFLIQKCLAEILICLIVENLFSPRVGHCPFSTLPAPLRCRKTPREISFPERGGSLPSHKLPAPLRCGRANLYWRNALVLPPRLKSFSASQDGVKTISSARQVRTEAHSLNCTLAEWNLKHKLLQSYSA